MVPDNNQYQRPEAKQGYPRQPQQAAQAPVMSSQPPEMEPTFRPQPLQQIMPEKEDVKQVVSILDHGMILPLAGVVLILIIAVVVYFVVFAPGAEEVVETAVSEETVVAEEIPSSSQPIETLSSDTADASASSVSEDDRKRDVSDKPGYCKDMVADGKYETEDACFLGQAKENLNDDYCQAIEDVRTYSDCIISLALLRSEADICTGLPSGPGFVSRAECYFRFTEEFGSSQWCYMIDYDEGEFSKNHCLLELAKKEGDPVYCTLMGPSETYPIEDCEAAVGVVGVSDEE